MVYHIQNEVMASLQIWRWKLSLALLGLIMCTKNLILMAVMMAGIFWYSLQWWPSIFYSSDIPMSRFFTYVSLGLMFNSTDIQSHCLYIYKAVVVQMRSFTWCKYHSNSVYSRQDASDWQMNQTESEMYESYYHFLCLAHSYIIALSP